MYAHIDTQTCAQLRVPYHLQSLSLHFPVILNLHIILLGLILLEYVDEETANFALVR